MKKILSNSFGFSLIELIVVIAILGVLVGVAAPNLMGYIEKTKVATDIQNMENIKRAAEAYVAENYETVLPDTGKEDITDEVEDESFNGTYPELKSKNKTAIKVEVDSDGVVTVEPTKETLETK